MCRLANKVAIVTGASQGIGAAYARGLAAAGARVVVSDIIDAAALAREINDAGGTALALCADVTDPDSVLSMVRAAIGKWGALDILVNNAALFGMLERKPARDIPSEEWDAVMRVNVRGTFECIKAALPHMQERRSGKIINITSGTILMGTPMLLHYVTSKGAIVAMTRALARELGEFNICVNCVAPGLTMSENVKKTITPAKVQASVAVRSIKREQTPDDLVGTVLFLASPDSDFITGQMIVVDGGVVFS